MPEEQGTSQNFLGGGGNGGREPAMKARRQEGPGFGTFGRAFSNLAIRPKLMVLHNIFFLVLSVAVYFALIPPFENRIRAADEREGALLTQMLASGSTLTGLPALYRFSQGSAALLGIDWQTRQWLDEHCGQVWPGNSEGQSIFRKEPATGLYQRLTLPHRLYTEAVTQARWTLVFVLGAIYILAVASLELIIMPVCVYRPLRLMLQADAATQRDDREHELIDTRLIPGDELGQIMRSRNAAIQELRRQEDDLERKNYLLETAKQNLADQDRLASLGLLSAGVAHELNTPLAVLQGSIEKLKETVGDGVSQERLARMLRVAQRLKKISESLLDFARVRGRQMEPLSLRDVVDDAWGLVSIEDKASTVRFINMVKPTDVVTGNADRLVQVFVNLLRNSVTALRPPGVIFVSSRQFSSGGNPWIAVDVDDDGPGISTGVLPKIFEAFITTRLDARGTGLGLTIAEGIVHQHGGNIEASNRPGGGARLEVRLPAASSALSNAPQGSATT